MSHYGPTSNPLGIFILLPKEEQHFNKIAKMAESGNTKEAHAVFSQMSETHQSKFNVWYKAKQEKVRASEDESLSSGFSKLSL